MRGADGQLATQSRTFWSTRWGPVIVIPGMMSSDRATALLRASLAERFAAYSQGTQAGFLNINTIHRLEDLPPVDGGDGLDLGPGRRRGPVAGGEPGYGAGWG